MKDEHDFLTLEELIADAEELSKIETKRIETLAPLECYRFGSSSDSWTRWNGIKLYRRVYCWGLNQVGNVPAAFPTFDTRGGKHEVIYFRNLEMVKYPYREVGGRCTCSLTECHENKCVLMAKKVEEVFGDVWAKRGAHPGVMPSFFVTRTKEFYGRPLKNIHVKWDDVKSGDLGDPSFNDPRNYIKTVVNYGKSKRGYVAAYPNFNKAEYPRTGLVFGVNLIKSNGATLEYLYDSELPSSPDC